jgi:hypothetical protein
VQWTKREEGRTVNIYKENREQTTLAEHLSLCLRRETEKERERKE